MTRSHIYKLYYIVLHCTTLWILTLLYCIRYITLYYIILRYITLYYIILHYIISYHIALYILYSILPCYMIIFTILSYNQPFCCSFVVNFAPEQTIRPTTNPIAAVPRFSFFFESDRNRPFGRRFETTTEIFWMLLSEVEEATTNNNEEMLGVCFFLARNFFSEVFFWILHEKNATVNKYVWHFLGGQEIAHAGAPNISLRTMNETSIKQRAFFNASQEIFD